MQNPGSDAGVFVWRQTLHELEIAFCVRASPSVDNEGNAQTSGPFASRDCGRVFSLARMARGAPRERWGVFKFFELFESVNHDYAQNVEALSPVMRGLDPRIHQSPGSNVSGLIGEKTPR
ncbi:hypothetical protein V4R08_02380 [Nitrobacter sp. NHB1]|uniref:hypothetical protein n=1 Tax=Nitrobacter sp. NHB1 TaxID=3119830 RepID=UPI002FFE1F2F